MQGICSVGSVTPMVCCWAWLVMDICRGCACSIDQSHAMLLVHPWWASVLPNLRPTAVCIFGLLTSQHCSQRQIEMAMQWKSLLT